MLTQLYNIFVVIIIVVVYHLCRLFTIIRIPETTHVSRVHNFATILWLQFVICYCCCCGCVEELSP